MVATAARVGSADEVVEKVVAIITRGSGAETEILVFRHRFSGMQLPAGTVERGEPVDAALLREVREETGLQAVVVDRKLALLDERLPPSDLMVTDWVEPLTAPHQGAARAEGTVRRGMGFRCWEERNGFARIAYRQGDMASGDGGDDQVQAWISTTAVSRRIRRHIYHLYPAEDTPARWLVKDAEAELSLDFHVYWTLLWSALGLHPIQDGWLRAGLAALETVQR